MAVPERHHRQGHGDRRVGCGLQGGDEPYGVVREHACGRATGGTNAHPVDQEEKAAALNAMIEGMMSVTSGAFTPQSSMDSFHVYARSALEALLAAGFELRLTRDRPRPDAEPWPARARPGS